MVLVVMLSVGLWYWGIVVAGDGGLVRDAVSGVGCDVDACVGVV